MNISINKDRFKKTFDHFSSIGETENGGLDRVALSDANVEARDELVRRLQDIRCTVSIDRVGNIFGERSGTSSSADPVLIGSHLDTVPYGGRYDGQLGVLTALETLQSIDDAGIETTRPVTLVNWTGEEGSRFDRGLIGSTACTGYVDVETALGSQDSNGVTLREVLSRTGYDGSYSLDAEAIDSYVELHIEQGRVLERADTAVGISEGVWGSNGIEIIVKGRADHAGTTPMYDRDDPMTAAARAIHNIANVPSRIRHEIVTTVGEVDVHPGASNVIPKRVRFTVDMRSPKREALETGEDEIRNELDSACAREGVEYELRSGHTTEFVPFSPRATNAIERGAKRTETSFKYMMNGAGHDAKPMQHVTDAGLMFVPSADGISHNESEFTEWEHVIAGAQVFADAVVQLATSET